MARLWICGWELQTSKAYPASGTHGNGLTFDTSVYRSGICSGKITNGATGAVWQYAGEFVANLRVYVKITRLPDSEQILMGQDLAGQNNVRLTTAGALTLYNGTTLIGTSTQLLTDSSNWYCIEVNSGATSTLYIDENVAVSGSGAATMMDSVGVYSGTATYTINFDDMVADSSAYIGSGKVVLLVPTSLNAAGGWVEGDGAGTAGMAAAVATRPPPGVASASETSATNIESPTNSATDNCDMNMTTYAAAGIGPFDTVRAVQSIVRHGEDIATGTKAGAHTIVSNPAQSGEDTWNFGNDLGAHAAEAGLWRSDFGTVQTGGVTVDTAPVLRVGKRTATTRVVCVDFMGIYVDYTPAVSTTSPPFRRPFPRALITR